ncbi:MAG: GNAT family N-acetyltransferase [Ginsengibacter sp.]
MNVEIIGFSEDYSKYFAALNIAWLQKYFEVEPIDYEMLSEPKKYIIDKNGFIFFAKADDKIAGTFALIKVGNGIYELSKMAVAEGFQGKKIGNKMLEFCLSEMKR